MPNRQTVPGYPYTWVQWINVGLGIAIIVMPFIAGVTGTILTSDVVSGAVVIIVGLISFFSSASERGPLISWINVLAGIWLLISISFTMQPMLIWQDAVYGVLTILTAAIAMGLHNTHMRLTRGLA